MRALQLRLHTIKTQLKMTSTKIQTAIQLKQAKAAGRIYRLQQKPWFVMGIVISLVCLVSEWMSIASLTIAGLYSLIVPWPWAWFSVIQLAGWLPVFIALLTVVTAFALMLYYFRGGLGRWLAVNFIKALFMLYFGVWLGLIIFSYWENLQNSLSPLALWPLLSAMPWPSLAAKHLCISLSISVGSMLMLVGYCFFQKYHPEKKQLGNAHFANCYEIYKAGFYDKDGLIVAKAHGRALKAGGFEHVLIFAPAGSGKSTAIAIPNLLTWEFSCVVNDTKYELFELTSGFREKQFNNKGSMLNSVGNQILVSHTESKSY